ncbi:NAD-dependent epimerase/dehydratase family protein [Rhodococcus maanshanensis]|uniref:Nucleoside-diphosphate-sugar epimerase n=1 Tax=Rhodococcus maanshanensis TaxID=183556 RepID=A0A1H7MLN2_9NOCA|nr:NAD-dependent epimerase/dehydratase family protein [Rhodococcus maanshanensis]SEL12064.1 Nucleoside-diphosphate-sugar epimerase [Rhodococcus maanshanensis]
MKSTLASRRVLVTGAAGFIGSRLCTRLQELGAEVHGVSRRSREGGGAFWWKADLAEYPAAHHVMEEVRPDLVFHLAGEVNGARDVSMIRPTIRNNLLPTVNLLTSASELGGPRVILAGSATEPDPDQIPTSPYAASKAASSIYARTFHARYGLPVTNLRLSMVYGPGQQDYGKLVPYVTRTLLRGEVPRLTSGANEFDWVYVDDVVEAFTWAASDADCMGETLDIGSGELVSVRSVVERIVRLADRTVQPQFGVVPDRSGEVSLLADVRRTREVLGWQARTSLDEGLATTVEWYRERHARDA